MKNKKFNYFLKLVISLISTYSIIYVTGNINNKYSLSSFLFIIIYILIVKLYKSNLTSKEKLFPIITGLILGITQVCGYNLYNIGTVGFRHLNTYLSLIGLSVLYYSLTCLIINNLEMIKDKILMCKIKFLDKKLFNKKVVIKCMILILLAWLPVLLAFYPGNYAFDSPGEFLDYFNKNYVSGNPPAHGFLLGSIMNIGHVVFKSYNTGILLYSILQMLILSFTMGCVINFLVKRKCPNIINFIVLLLFMFLPTHSIMAITTTKDILFSCAVTLFFIKFYSFYFEKHKYHYIRNIIEIILIIVLIMLIFILRPNGVYGYVFMMLFVIIPLRKKWKSLLVINILVFTMYYNYNNFLDKYAYINPADPLDCFNAIFTVPYQQLARTYPKTDEETKEILDEFVPKDENGKSWWLSYSPRRADGVFIHSNNRYLNTNKKKFFEIYLKTGLKHPTMYLDAFLDNSIGYWYIADSLPDKTTIRPYIEFNNQDVFNITNNEVKLDSKIPSLYEYYYRLVVDGEFQKNPLLSILMSTAVINLVFIIAMAYMICKKNFKKIWSLSLFVGLMGTNLLGPTCILRYMYYLYICLPVIIYIAFSKNDKKLTARR